MDSSPAPPAVQTVFSRFSLGTRDFFFLAA